MDNRVLPVVVGAGLLCIGVIIGSFAGSRNDVLDQMLTAQSSAPLSKGSNELSAIQAPSSFRAVNITSYYPPLRGGPYSIGLSWASVSGATRYDIFRSADGAEFEKIKILTATNDSIMFFTDTAVKPIVKYVYKIRSSNDVVSSSFATSDVVEVGLNDLEAPSDLRGVYGVYHFSPDYSKDYIDLSWKDNSTYETAFYIFRTETPSTANTRYYEFVPYDKTFYRDFNVEEGKTYYYTVVASGRNGEYSIMSSPSNTWRLKASQSMFIPIEPLNY